MPLTPKMPCRARLCFLTFLKYDPPPGVSLKIDSGADGSRQIRRAAPSPRSCPGWPNCPNEEPAPPPPGAAPWFPYPSPAEICSGIPACLALDIRVPKQKRPFVLRLGCGPGFRAAGRPHRPRRIPLGHVTRNEAPSGVRSIRSPRPGTLLPDVLFLKCRSKGLFAYRVGVHATPRTTCWQGA
jgi:hypothetical protein